MSSYKKQYDKRKEEIIKLLEVAESYCQRFSYDEKAEIFKELTRQVQKGYFSIVVVGEFSAGKSCFLNALMGEKYLPSFTNETTATINFLRHSSCSTNQQGLAIHFTDPNQLPEYSAATFENIERYVSTRSNDFDVKSEIDRVELYLDSPFLQDGVMLVDSPGLNGVAEGHQEITEKQIEKSHACIFMFSADQPGKKSDFEFLANLQSKVDTILLVLNKIDLLKLDEQAVDDVVKKLKENYHICFPKKPIPEIWPLAAYPALVARSQRNLDYQNRANYSGIEKEELLHKSQIENFENRIWRFLTQGEKGQQEMIAPIARVMNLLGSQKKELCGRIEALKNVADTEEITQQIFLLEKEILAVEENLQSQRCEIEEQISLRIKETVEKIKSKTLEIGRSCAEKVDKWEDFSYLNDDVESFNQNIQKSYSRAVSTVYKDFLEEFQSLIKRRYSKYASQILTGMNNEEVKIPFEFSLSADSFNCSFGLEDYQEKVSKMEQEIKNIDEQIDSNEMDKINAVRLLEKKDDLEEEMKKVRNRENFLTNGFGPKPLLSRREFDEIELRDRRGVLGKLTEILIGKKETRVTRVEIDDSELQDYYNSKKEFQDKNQFEMNKIQNQLANLPNSEKCPAQYEREKCKLERSQAKMQLQMDELREQHKKDFQNKQQRALRKIKEEVEELLKDTEKSILEVFKTELKRRSRNLSDLAIDVVAKNVIELISRNQEEISIKKRQLESSQEQKSVWIEQYTKEIEELTPILEKAVILHTELELMEVDIIAED